MRLATRHAVLAVAAAGAVLAAGCGGDSCSISPEIAEVPGPCTLRQGQPVTVEVGWCSCNASTVCEVRLGEAGIIELEPRVNSCDATCEPNPGSCPIDPVLCTFTIPSGDFDTLLIHGGLSFEEVPLTVAGTGTSCSI